ncbi:related to NAD(P)H-dependent oxidoreductase [Pseudozyma flocculosa]|nr:related to NAD(P)H-dependent oxidoreductase [Pseudozyma flocculosa]
MTMSARSLHASTLFDLTGKIALITGGGTGIGLMQARTLSQAGAKVYIVGRRAEVLDKSAQLYSEPNAPLVPLPGDISKKAECLRLADEISKREGKLDILISNAGIVGPKNEGSNTADPTGQAHPEHREKLPVAEYAKLALEDNEPEHWNELFTVNTFANFFLSMAFLPLLAKATQDTKGWSSTFITVGSISGITSQSQRHVAYNASKAAANHMTRLIGFEVAASTDAKVRVNGIAPGVFPSQMTASDKDDETNQSSLREKMPELNIPAGRPGRDEDMASATLFVVANQYLNGQVIPVDGGFTLTEP